MDVVGSSFVTSKYTIWKSRILLQYLPLYESIINESYENMKLRRCFQVIDEEELKKKQLK